MRNSLSVVLVTVGAAVLSTSGRAVEQGPGPGAGDDIVFFSARAGNNEIYRMTGDPAFPLRITDHSSTDVDPAISPNGEKLAVLKQSGTAAATTRSSSWADTAGAPST